jgi:hypothetical protein
VAERLWWQATVVASACSTSAVDQLADIAARSLRETARRLLVWQRSLEVRLTKMADHWHAAHCRTTQIASYRDCYHTVCKRNAEELAAHVSVLDEPGGC